MKDYPLIEQLISDKNINCDSVINESLEYYKITKELINQTNSALGKKTRYVATVASSSNFEITSYEPNTKA